MLSEEERALGRPQPQDFKHLKHIAETQDRPSEALQEREEPEAPEHHRQAVQEDLSCEVFASGMALGPQEDDAGQWPASSCPSAPSELTTLMIRNIPGRYTKAALAEDLLGHEEWDFLYLPGGCGSATNRNYAFINFGSAADARAFLSRWHKQRLPRFRAQKRLNVCFAALQGLHANSLAVWQHRYRDRCGGADCFCTPIVTAAPEVAIVHGCVVSF